MYWTIMKICHHFDRTNCDSAVANNTSNWRRLFVKCRALNSHSPNNRTVSKQREWRRRRCPLSQMGWSLNNSSFSHAHTHTHTRSASYRRSLKHISTVLTFRSDVHATTKTLSLASFFSSLMRTKVMRLLSLFLSAIMRYECVFYKSISFRILLETHLKPNQL